MDSGPSGFGVDTMIADVHPLTGRPTLGLAALIVAVDLGNPIDIDAGSLLNGERMIRWFQLDVRAHAIIPEMRTRLQVFGARVEREFSGEPPEEWAYMRSVVHVEACNKLIEMVLAEGYPNSPDEWLRLVMDRDF